MKREDFESSPPHGRLLLVDVVERGTCLLVHALLVGTCGRLVTAPGLILVNVIFVLPLLVASLYLHCWFYRRVNFQLLYWAEIRENELIFQKGRVVRSLSINEHITWEKPRWNDFATPGAVRTVLVTKSERIVIDGSTPGAAILIEQLRDSRSFPDA